ncbi:MAG: hypothetical protein R2879_02510 [Saprospiraceae bacterium]
MFNFNLVSIAIPIFTEQSWTLPISAPLTVGNTYYLVFDANGANVCDISVSVISGSTQAPAIDQPVIIDGPIRVCRSINRLYRFNRAGANRYMDLGWSSDWTKDYK